MNQRRDIPGLLAAFRAGDPAAAAELYAICVPYVRATVRRHLPHRLRPRFDSIDFVQDVWASFLALPSSRREFADAESIRNFLARVAHNKVIDVSRHQLQTKKNDITREILEPADEREIIDPPARTATPSQWAIAGEAWERLLDKIPPGHRVIVERLREGHNHEDIARMTNVSVTTVNRIVRRLKDLTGL